MTITNYTPHKSADVPKCPETVLMMAVLQDALVTFHRGLNSRCCEDAAAFREVDYWFRSRDADSPFSFESICSTLDIGVGYVRDRLNRLMKESLTSGQLARKPVMRRPGNRPRRY